MSYSQGSPASADGLSLVSTLQLTNQVLTKMLAAYNAGNVVADYYHISGAGTFEIKATSGTLFSLNINQGATASTGTLYNAASAAAVAGTLEIGVMDFNVAEPKWLPMGPDDRGVLLNNGLVVVTAGSADITIGYL